MAGCSPPPYTHTHADMQHSTAASQLPNPTLQCSMMASFPPYPALQVPIKRPSGVRFDASGRLWVTSMDPDAGLLCFAGPGGAGSAEAGTLHRSLCSGELA